MLPVMLYSQTFARFTVGAKVIGEMPCALVIRHRPGTHCCWFHQFIFQLGIERAARVGFVQHKRGCEE
jgi:hypothetical protein